MSLWLVRAGKYGEQEQGALENDVVTIGWNELPDLSNVKTRVELAKLYGRVHPIAKKHELQMRLGKYGGFFTKYRTETL